MSRRLRSVLSLFVVLSLVLVPLQPTLAAASQSTNVAPPSRLISPAITTQDISRPVTSVKPTFDRISGSNPVDEGVALSRSWSKASSVVIVGSGDWTEAMSAPALAGALHAPILVTTSHSLSKATDTRLSQLRTKTVYLVGSGKWFGSAIAKRLKAKHIHVSALKGKNAYDTARLVALKVKALVRVTPVVIALSASDVSEAGAVSAYSAAAAVPVLLVTKTKRPSETASALKSLKPTTSIIIGGTGLISNTVAKSFPSNARIAGKTAYDTSVLLADYGVRHGLSLAGATLAPARADTMLVGPRAALLGSPILLSSGTSLSSGTASYISKFPASFKRLHVFGTTKQLTTKVVNSAVTAAATYLYADVVRPDSSATSGVSATVVTTDTVVLTGSEAKLAAITSGTVLVGSPSNVAPQGYLRKVTGTPTWVGTTLVCSTTDGSLSDVIAEGGFEVSAASGSTALHVTSFARSTSARAAAMAAGFGADIALSVTDDGSGKLSGGVRLSGHIGCEAVTTFTWHQANWWSSPDHIEVRTVETEKLTLTADGFVKGTYDSKPVDLLPETYLTTIPTPVTGVAITVSAAIDFKVKIEGQFGAKTSFTWAKSYESGFAWTPSGGVQGIAVEHPATSSFGKPTVYATASIKPEVELWLKLKIDGIAGPDIAACPYVDVKATASAAADHFDFSVSAGLDGSIGGELKVFGVKCSAQASFTIAAEATLCKLTLPATSRGGAISGLIVDATTGDSVAGALVQLHRGADSPAGVAMQTVTTDDNGFYQFSDVAAGDYTVSAVLDGYVSNNANVSVFSDAVSNVDVALSSILGANEMRVVLTWGEIPADLDAHLTGPDDSGGRFHIYFSNQQYCDSTGSLVAELDHDVTTSYGPETVTSFSENAGTYRYSVHDYANRDSTYSVDLENSGAIARVYRGDALVATFRVPSGDGTLWTVFEMSNGVITPVNTMSYESDPGNVQ